MSAPTNDKTAQARGRAVQKTREEQQRDDLRWLMASETGRRVAYSVVFERAGAMASSYSSSGQDMARREGMREVGLTLAADLQEAAPESYVLMLQERFAEAALEAVAERATPKPNRSHTR